MVKTLKCYWKKLAIQTKGGEGLFTTYYLRQHNILPFFTKFIFTAKIFIFYFRNNLDNVILLLLLFGFFTFRLICYVIAHITEIY